MGEIPDGCIAVPYAVAQRLVDMNGYGDHPSPYVSVERLLSDEAVETAEKAARLLNYKHRHDRRYSLEDWPRKEMRAALAAAIECARGK